MINEGKNYVVIALAVMVLWSCNRHATPFKEVQSPGSYTIQVPSYMRMATDLLPGRKSAVQYANDSAEAYLIIIDTLRKNMRENSLRSFYDSMVVCNLGDSGTEQPGAKFAMLHNDSCLITERRAALQGSKAIVVYRIEVVASPKRFYYIQLWTRLEKNDALKSDFDRILDSFTAVKE